MNYVTADKGREVSTPQLLGDNWFLANVKVPNPFCAKNGFSLLLTRLVIRYGVTVDATGAHIVKKVTEWGKGAGPFTINKGPNSFNIPHGLALAAFATVSFRPVAVSTVPVHMVGFIPDWMAVLVLSYAVVLRIA